MLTWIALLVGSAALFLVLEMLVFPKIFLRSKYSIGATSDRGIRKYKTSEDGLYYVYEPSWLVRKFIKQYVIAATPDGRKTLTCMVAEGVEYAEYDAVLFDASNRVCKILSVQQLFKNGVYAEEIELPPETAYATLVLNRINNRALPHAARSRISAGKLAGYGLSTCVTAMVTAVCINLSFAHLFGKVFRETYAAAMGRHVAVVAVALVASVACTALLSLALILKNKKK